MKHSKVFKFQFQAVETINNKLRVANDKRGNVIIMTDDVEPFTAPYLVALYGELYRYSDSLEIYIMTEEEIAWVWSIGAFAKQLSYHK